MSSPLLCPENKIPEALGAIADGRIEINNESSSRCYSSSKNKFYTTEYCSIERQIYSNDNMSYYNDGLVGYPAIAHLLAIGAITFDRSILPYFGGYLWKDLNQKNKNDFNKTNEEVFSEIKKCGGPIQHIREVAQSIAAEITALQLNCILPKRKPPEGY